MPLTADRLINALQASSFLPTRVRHWLIRRMGVEMQLPLFVEAGCSFMAVQQNGGLRIARGAFLNHGCVVEAHGGVTIGERVWLGPEAMILTATHDIGTAEQRGGASVSRPVSIGAGCWIGARAVILPGVTIAPGCVVAAGAVVTRDTQPNGTYSGVPAERVKELAD